MCAAVHPVFLEAPNCAKIPTGIGPVLYVAIRLLKGHGGKFWSTTCAIGCSIHLEAESCFGWSSWCINLDRPISFATMSANKVTAWVARAW